MAFKGDNLFGFKYLLKTFLITRIILVIMMVGFNFLISFNEFSIYDNVLNYFDNEHYLNIALNGYVYDYEYAFFPLTPFLIRYLGKIGFLITNQIFVFLSGYLFYLLSRDIFKKKDIYFPSFLWFVSPISIFTCMFYSEALFLFLTLLSYYLYKTKKSYLSLGFVLGLCVLTRSLGSMLFFTIFISMFVHFLKGKERFKNILIVFMPATIISCIYPIFLYVKTGDFLYFMTVQFTHWQRVNTNIFRILYDSAIILFNNPFFLFIIDFIITFGVIGYSLFFIIKKWKNKVYYEIFLYLIFSLLAICSTIRANYNPLASFYRYIFGCFPIYFMIRKNTWISMFMIFITLFISMIFLMGIHFY